MLSRRMLHWQPSGRGPLGRPAMNWTTKFEQVSRLKHWRDWNEVAADADRWMMETDEFIKFLHNRRTRLTGCLYLPTFRPGSRPKVRLKLRLRQLCVVVCCCMLLYIVIMCSTLYYFETIPRCTNFRL